MPEDIITQSCYRPRSFLEVLNCPVIGRVRNARLVEQVFVEVNARSRPQ